MKKWLYPSSIQEATSIQKEMAERVSTEDQFGSIRLIGGMDVSNSRFDPKKMVYASSVVLEDYKLITSQSIGEHQPFPYITGYLGFREAPSLVETFNRLEQIPDLIMVDGHGIAHPRGLGIASHIGVLLDRPTIGVAKSVLVGEPAGHLGKRAGSTTPLVWKGNTIGMFVRTKANCNPLIISVGHKVSLETAVELVLCSCKGYRLPEPTRQAHLAANAFRKSV